MSIHAIPFEQDHSTDSSNQILDEISPIDLAICRLVRAGSDPASVSSGIQAEEWVEITSRAIKYQLTSVIYNRLKRTSAWSALPETARAGLHREHMQNTASALARYHRLGQILTDFIQQEIAVIVLKGAFLGEIVYGDEAERTMSDIDLLVPEALIEQAIDRLRSAGYCSFLDHPAQEDFPFHHHAPPFVQQGFPTIELHWMLVTPKEKVEIDLDGVWQRAQPAMIADVPVLGLAPEDLLLYLCVHATIHHLKGGLRAVYDIAATCNHYASRIDWENFLSRAHMWKAQRSAFLMLALAKDLLGASVPPPILSALQPNDFDPAFFRLAHHLIFFSGSTAAPIPVHVVKLQNTKGVWGKTRLLFGRFFPPVSDISLHFGVSRRSWRVWLYYPARWRELFVQQSRLVWKLWRGDPLLLKREQDVTRRLHLEERLSSWLAAESPNREAGE